MSAYEMIAQAEALLKRAEEILAKNKLEMNTLTKLSPNHPKIAHLYGENCKLRSQIKALTTQLKALRRPRSNAGGAAHELGLPTTRPRSYAAGYGEELDAALAAA